MISLSICAFVVRTMVLSSPPISWSFECLQMSALSDPHYLPRPSFFVSVEACTPSFLTFLAIRIFEVCVLVKTYNSLHGYVPERFSGSSNGDLFFLTWPPHADIVITNTTVV